MLKQLRTIIIICLLTFVAVESFRTYRDHLIYSADHDGFKLPTAKEIIAEKHSGRPDDDSSKLPNYDLKLQQRILNRHKRVKKNAIDHHPDINKLIAKKNSKKHDDVDDKQGRNIVKTTKYSPHHRTANSHSLGALNTNLKISSFKSSKNLKKESLKKDTSEISKKSKKTKSSNLNKVPIHLKMKAKEENKKLLKKVKESKQKRSLTYEEIIKDDKGKKFPETQKHSNHKKDFSRRHKKLGRNFISLEDAKRELDKRRHLANVIHNKMKKYKSMKKPTKIRHYADSYYNFNHKSSHKNLKDNPYRINIGSKSDSDKLTSKPTTLKSTTHTFTRPFKLKNQPRNDELIPRKAKLTANNKIGKVTKDNKTKLVAKRRSYIMN